MSVHKKQKTYHFYKEWEIDFFYHAERQVHMFHKSINNIHNKKGI